RDARPAERDHACDDTAPVARADLNGVPLTDHCVCGRSEVERGRLRTDRDRSARVDRDRDREPSGIALRWIEGDERKARVALEELDRNDGAGRELGGEAGRGAQAHRQDVREAGGLLDDAELGAVANHALDAIASRWEVVVRREGGPHQSLETPEEAR